MSQLIYSYKLRKGGNFLDINKAFGITLKKYRVNFPLSQEKLALNCSLDRTFISLLERGKRNPSLKTLFSICEALNVKPNILESQKFI